MVFSSTPSKPTNAPQAKPTVAIWLRYPQEQRFKNLAASRLQRASSRESKELRRDLWERRAVGSAGPINCFKSTRNWGVAGSSVSLDTLLHTEHSSAFHVLSTSFPEKGKPSGVLRRIARAGVSSEAVAAGLECSEAMGLASQGDGLL